MLSCSHTFLSPLQVRFIEYMPFDGNVWSDRKMVTYRELLERVGAAFPQGLERCRDPRGEVAKNFRVSECPAVWLALGSDCLLQRAVCLGRAGAGRGNGWKGQG